MTRNELFDVLNEMIDHVGVEGVLDEMTQAMSTDELKESVKHLDQHLFANHFLALEDWKFDRILK